VTVLLAALLAVIVPTTAVAIDLPSESSAAPAPAPVPSAVTAPALAAPVAAAPVTLRVGSRGAAVRDLQRELRRRGYRYVRVDGAYGPATRRAVKALQKRLRMRASGIADPRLLRRLGIQATGVAAVPTSNVGATLGARYLRAFPVLGDYSYSDDYGAARHQGSHEGNDIMADRGTPVVAVADGVIERMTRVETGLGGIWIWLRDTRGNEYYYAHLVSIAEGLNAGSRVAVGQVIGAVGNTGDARATLPHLHFEIHPGGGGAVNPYTDLRAVDPKARTAG
jgi:murein DD-endopeptidase MepM/ murein hydrolase activator NlpD